MDEKNIIDSLNKIEQQMKSINSNLALISFSIFAIAIPIFIYLSIHFYLILK